LPPTNNSEPPVLPCATNWLQYDFYEFVTYERLRPPDCTGEKVFWSRIAKTRSELLYLGVLGQLTDLQANQVAAITVDCIAITENYRSFQKAEAALGELARVFGRRNVAKIKKAVALLRPIAETGIDENPNQPDVRLRDLVTALDSLAAHLSRLRTSGDLPHAKVLRQIHPQPDNPKDKIVWVLFDFLVSQCMMPINEAEVRVAKIGNHYFN
jgi:hypothetical protein